MKWFGKNNERSVKEEKSGKKPELKSVLLQTYFTSLLSLVLCVGMFFGTSYAWFTSEVTNEGNEIYIGTLDVELEKQTEGKQTGIKDDDVWTSLSAVDADGGNTTKLFDGSVRWEPGYTALEVVRISNTGDLAFRYELQFTNGKITSVSEEEDADEMLKAVAENFLVYIHPGDYGEFAENPEEDKRPVSFRYIEESAYWTPVRFGKDIATLADILEKGLPVLAGSITDTLPETAAAAEDETAEKPDIDETFIIALHMKEETDPETMQSIMGQTLSLNVKLTAYQTIDQTMDGLGNGHDLQMQITDLGAMTVDAAGPLNDNPLDAELDAAYQFRPVQTATEAMNTPYRGYHADFVITADQDIAPGAMELYGYYAAWCQSMDDRWVRMPLADGLEKDKELRLLESVNAQFNMETPLVVYYEEMCDLMDDGIGFLCGVKNHSAEESGASITVELRLYEVDQNGEETGQYITVGTRVYPAPDAANNGQ